MNSRTRQQIQQIRTRLKSRLTEQQEFKTDDLVIEYAVNLLHQDLKKRGML